LCCRAMLRVNEGHINEAWEDLLAGHRLCRLVTRGCSLLEAYAGIRNERMVSQADVAYLAHAKLSAAQLQVCLRNLQELPPATSVADHAELGERITMLDALVQVARHGTPDLDKIDTAANQNADTNTRLFTWSINWDPALRQANQLYDQCAAACRLTERDARQRALEDIHLAKYQMSVRFLDTGNAVKSWISASNRGKTIGGIVIGILFPAFEKVLEAEDRSEQTEHNLHVAFVLAAYHYDHGRYPATLEDLAPKYLEKIPNDLFSGQPLTYKPDANGYLLYSVGPNGIDDDGRGYDDEPRGDDLSVRMPVPEPKGKNY